LLGLNETFVVSTFPLKKLEAEGETLTSAGGKMDELNSILSRTQHKINAFKVRKDFPNSEVLLCSDSFPFVTAIQIHASSLTNLLKFKSGFSDSKESLDTEGQPGQSKANNDINEALDALDEMKANEQAAVTVGPVISDEAIRQAKIDREKKQASNVDKLDSLITGAENAQYSMKHQSNQMKQFMK
jgi:hypothetical protein